MPSVAKHIDQSSKASVRRSGNHNPGWTLLGVLGQVYCYTPVPFILPVEGQLRILASLASPQALGSLLRSHNC